MKRLFIIASVFLASAASAQTPEDFTRFIVPGQESTMDSLRELFWLHYPGAGPKALIWEEWLSLSSLWPALQQDEMAKAWRGALSTRIMTEEGYVATHQHASIAHQLGWPFPFWKQGKNTWGWHFSLSSVPGGWHGTEVRTAEGWEHAGVTPGAIDSERGWTLEITEPEGMLTAPAGSFDTFESPFIQLRWFASGDWSQARPYIAWRAEGQEDFAESRRMYFEPPKHDGLTIAMVPCYRHSEWTGTAAQLRLGIEYAPVGATVAIHSMFNQYDTRHNINNPNFILGCSNYFRWTGDINFLREQLPRMRMAMHYMLEVFQARKTKMIVAPWVGHDGEPGIEYDAEGNKHLRHGHGIGSNYWDLLPFGREDAYATLLYYDALLRLAELEEAAASNPGWNMPRGALAFDANFLRDEAALVKAKANEVFWNADNGRFILGIDDQGNTHDFGFTFMNLEAIYYDFATPEHAEAIMQWITGARVVEGDTAQGDGIYHWRFAPRATTKRNITFYGWFWSGPESIAYGDQIQDGGAVLGFAYFDLMARIKLLGPENAAARLVEMMQWFDEVQAAGGYRPYYEANEGSLQGGGTAGGLGLDQEFFESVLVPQTMLYGFMGVQPGADGILHVAPKLPETWPSLTITAIRYQGATFDLTAEGSTVTVKVHEGSKAPKVTVAEGHTLKVE
jgi:hypothetical protein